MAIVLTASTLRKHEGSFFQGRRKTAWLLDKVMSIPLSFLLEKMIFNIVQKHGEMALLFCIIKELHILTQLNIKTTKHNGEKQEYLKPLDRK